LLAAEILTPTAPGLAFFDFTAGSGLLVGFAFSQFQQQAGVLYFFLESSQGFFHVAIRYHD